MKRFSQRVASLTPSITVGLILFAVALTALLAYRAFEASRGQRRLTERTLQDYAGFAAFQLKNATFANIAGQHRQAFDLIVRTINTRGPVPPLGAERAAAPIRERGATCRCLDSISFFYQVTFADSAIEATASELATSETLRRIRDTVMAQARGPSRAEPAFPSPAGTRPIGVAITSQYLVTIFSTLGSRPYVFTHAVSADTGGTPVIAYGFAVPAKMPVGRAVSLVLSLQPVLPSTLVKPQSADSILAVTVSTASGAVVYEHNAAITAMFAATDSLEPRFGGLRFKVAIDPAAVGRLIIGGLPRSRLPEVLASAFLAVGLLGLLLHQFRRQEELGRLRDEFVSGVSHELRTPLAQIRLLAELLRLGKVPTEEQRERSLRIIDKEARRLSFLVDSILSFSHARRVTLSPVRTDVSSEVDEIVSGFAPLAEAHGVRLSTRLHAGLEVDVDRGALRQVVLNLLDNAVRYGPPDQEVVITTSRAGDRWTFEVRDQGPGIPIAERERIFAPYYRMARDTGGAVGGTGIGLAVVRRLVSEHGGEVQVGDLNGGAVGARLIVTLPVTVHQSK